MNSTDRRVYIDGGSKGTNATNASDSALDRTSIGRAGDSTPDGYFDGRLAEISFWRIGSLGVSDFENRVIPLLAAAFDSTAIALG